MNTPLKQDADADYLLIGGGLQNALILLALAARKPDASITLLEREDALGGNHIWSFQALDLPESANLWASALFEYTWPGYQIHFDHSSRWVQGSYRSCSSEHLDRVVRGVADARANICLRTGTPVARCDANSATLENGEVLRGRIVVDARGPEQCAQSRGAASRSSSAWNVVCGNRL